MISISISIAIGILGLFAVVAWVVAVISAVQIVRLAPAGERLRTYGRLGWWRFDAIREQGARYRSAVAPHAARLRLLSLQK